MKSIEFLSNGLVCKGLWLPARGDVVHGCIIMAHGFGAIKEMRLPAYAEKFSRAGFHVLMFDYRYFGESEGQPRQLLDITKQLEDWHNAIAYVRSLDPSIAHRLILWGTSFSGGHVLRVASEDPHIMAILSQVPHSLGLASGMAGGLKNVVKLTMAGGLDLLKSALSLAPYYIPIVDEPGRIAIMNHAGDRSAYLQLLPKDKFFDNRVAARIGLQAVRYNPGVALKRLKCPVLLQLANDDNVTPIAPLLYLFKANKYKNITVERFNQGHFDPYVGDGFKKVLAGQLRFLKQFEVEPD